MWKGDSTKQSQLSNSIAGFFAGCPVWTCESRHWALQSASERWRRSCDFPLVALVCSQVSCYFFILCSARKCVRVCVRGISVGKKVCCRNLFFPFSKISDFPKGEKVEIWEGKKLFDRRSGKNCLVCLHTHIDRRRRCRVRVCCLNVWLCQCVYVCAGLAFVQSSISIV